MIPVEDISKLKGLLNFLVGKVSLFNCWLTVIGLLIFSQEKTSSEEMLETQKKRLSDQQEQLQSLNKSMSLNLSSKKEYSMFETFSVI